MYIGVRSQDAERQIRALKKKEGDKTGDALALSCLTVNESLQGDGHFVTTLDVAELA